MKRLRSFLALSAAAIALVAATPAPTLAQGKTVIERAEDLPRLVYTLPQKPSLLIQDRGAILDLAKRSAKDAADILAKYDIKDRAAAEGFQGAVRDLAMLEGRWDDALAVVEQIAAGKEKPGDRQTTGLFSRAYIAAQKAGGDAAAKQAAFVAALKAQLATTDWAAAGDGLKATKAGLETFNPELVVGSLEAQADKIFAANPDMPFGVARALVSTFLTLQSLPPYREAFVATVAAHIDANRTEKEDIWTPRLVALPAAAPLNPVVIAVWDSGVEAAAFEGRLWTNGKEKANGKDDDKNGFVDDLHGIAFDHRYAVATGILKPLTPEQEKKLPELAGLTKGSLDLQAGIDSPEADQLKKTIAGMKREEVGPFVQTLGLYGMYIHGTHVASIAAEGNPAARILAVRNDWPTELIPPAIDEAYAAAMVKSAKDSVAYMKANGVRVVNMSWRVTRGAIEGTLTANNLEADPKARNERAGRIFETIRKGLTEAFASAPDILFVAAAGNEDEDINFAGSVPAAVDLPNVVTVGAVDEAGQKTGFTSVGASVDLHTNGFQIDGAVPGGLRLKLSGTSMAAPQVANLAGKLLAVNPTLTPAQLLELIGKGADPATADGVKLVNPRRTFELAMAQ